MKKIFFILLSLVFFNCSLESDTPANTDVSPHWSLIRSIGGIAGTTTDYQQDQITWIFNESTGVLVVDHTTQGVSAALDPGTYDFSIQTIDNDAFIFIDNVEYGNILIGSTTFAIDQNVTSDGTVVADKFIYQFVR